MKADDILEVRKWLKQAWDKHRLQKRVAVPVKNMRLIGTRHQARKTWPISPLPNQGPGAEPEGGCRLDSATKRRPGAGQGPCHEDSTGRLSMEITRSDLKSSNPKGSDRSTVPMFSVLVEACFGDLND